jgi:uracil phosphoribosyltransferase
MKNVTVVEHPLVQHKLSLMRRKETPTAMFRQLIRELSMLLGYEVTRDLPMGKERIETPIMEMDAPVLTGKKLVFISVLRAGNGLLEGLLDLIPSARVGHVGLYRDPDTLVAVEYYFKVPDELDERKVIIVDPMLATANSAIAAVQRVKEAGARDIKFVCLLAAPEGIEAFQQAHPDVLIITAAIDDQLNDHGYIVPGLGDAGDRIYGTK